MTEHQRRALVRILRDEVAHSADPERLLLRARHWLYEHRLIIVHDRAIRALVAAALAELEATLIARPDVRVLPGLLTFGIRTGPALLVKGARLRGIRVQQHAALLHQHANESPERPENRRCELSLHGLSPSTRPEHGSDCSRAQAEKGRSDTSASRGWANNSGSTVKMRVVS